MTTITYSCAPHGRSLQITLCATQGDGSRQRQLITVGPTDSGYPSLSPNGTKAAYALAQGSSYQLFNHGVFVAHPDGRSPHKVWPAPHPPPSVRTEYFSLPGSPAWSPDGKELAITEPTDDPALNNQDCNVWIIPVSGGGAHRITDHSHHPVRCTNPSVTWSPDGQHVAYTASDRSASADGGGDELMSVPVHGGTPVLLAHQPGLIFTSIAWSPDSRTIAAVAEENGSRQPFPGYPGTLIGDDPDLIELVRTSATRPPVTIMHTPPTPTEITTLGGVAWSPDGTKLAFGRQEAHVMMAPLDPGSTPSPDTQTYAYDIVTMTPSGGDQMIVATNPSRGATDEGTDITSWVKTTG